MPRRQGLARRLCDRHYGIGADGLLFVQEGRKAPFEMEMYNPDGSRGEMCGNGIRCVGKYLRDQGWTKEKSFLVESAGAVKELSALEGEEIPGGLRMPKGYDVAGGLRMSEEAWMAEESRMAKGDEMEEELASAGSFGGGRKAYFRVDMGIPGEMKRENVAIQNGHDRYNFPQRETLELHCLSMGNPHAVLLLQKGEEWNVEGMGPYVERAECFPERTNAEFVKVLGRDRIAMRVWERGVGETLACGTGACAAATVCMQKGLTDEKITVTLLGGRLLVSKEGATGHIYLTGPAVTVFEGNLRESDGETFDLKDGRD